MKKAIVYASIHHGNTEKIVKSIAEECKVDLIDAVKHSDADLSSYDMIGFASGIYFSKFHQSILKFVEKHARVDGKFGCKGYDTFGPFKLVGGIAKGHPDNKDLQNAVGFVKNL